MKKIPARLEMPVYLFHQGTSRRAYDLLGAHFREGEKTTAFRVWAPHAESVSVVGDFNGWDRGRHPMARLTAEGLWEAEIGGCAQYDCYKYAIVTADGRELLKADPYAFHTETRPGNASKLYDLSGFPWRDGGWMEARSRRRPSAEPLNIYEVHLGSWRRNGDGSFYSYGRLADELVPYVREMGYTHVELLPVTEFPYDGSWGYQVTGYFAPTSRYGAPKDFMRLVDRFHQAGVGIIMDWVPAHFPTDGFGLADFDGDRCYEYSDPSRMEHREWGTRVFDFGRCEVESFLISSADFWAEYYHVDGIRVDAVASMLYLDYGRKEGEWRPNRKGGRENLEAVAFLRKLNAAVLSAHPGFLMTAEESTAWPLVTRPPSAGGLGFHYKWNMGWMNDILSYVGLDPYFRSYSHDRLTFSMMYAFSENFILPVSHDEVVHGKGSLLGRMPGSYEEKFAGLRTFLGYMMTHPGGKLLFMGCEFGQFIEWDSEKGLDWMLLDYPMHEKTRRYVKDLNHFYLGCPPLWQIGDSWDGFRWLNADDNTRSVVSCFREDEAGRRVLAVCNFAPVRWEAYRMAVPEAGSYREIFSSDAAEYGGSGFTNGSPIPSGEPGVGAWPNAVTVDLPPLSFLLFERLGPEASAGPAEREGNPCP